MTLLKDLIDIQEAKKPKCTCEDTGKAKCPVHGKAAMAEEHEDHDHVDDPHTPINHIPAKKDEYDGSIDFTGDLHELQAAIEKIEKILNAPKFRSYTMKTDQHFGTECDDKLNDVFGDFDHFKKAFEEFGDELDKAQ